MTTLDLERLVKMLGMTGSQHDGEALVALRKAQAVLKAAGKTWADLVGGGTRHGGGVVDRQAYQSAMALAAQRERERDSYRQTAIGLQRERDRLQAELDVLRQRQHQQATAAEFRSRANPSATLMTNYELWWTCCAVLDQHPEWLSEWERQFMGDWVSKSPGRMTDKQRAVMERIWAKADARSKGWG